MSNGSLNGLFYLMGGIISSISVGVMTSAAWGWLGVGLTFMTAALLSAFFGGGD